MARLNSDAPSPLDIHIGQRLMVLRALQGVTQKDLAEVLGVTFQQIQKYETGRNRLSAAGLYRVAKRLDASVGAFYEGYLGQGDPPPPDLSDPVINDCAGLLGEISADGRLACRAMLRVMAARA